jgi:hypothetical protein
MILVYNKHLLFRCTGTGISLRLASDGLTLLFDGLLPVFVQR